MRGLVSPWGLATAAWLVLTWSFTLHQLGGERERLLHDAEVRTVVEAQAFGEYSRANAERLSDFLRDLRAGWLAGPAVFAQAIRERREVMRELTFQVAVIDRDGRLAYSTIERPSSAVDLSERAHFRVHREAGDRDALYISDPIEGKVSGRWTIQFTRPILRAGRFDGVLVLSVAPGQFASFGRAFNLGAGGIATVVKDSGRILARIPDADGSLDKPLGMRPFLLRGAPPSGAYTGMTKTDGKVRLFGYYRVAELGLTFVIGESMATVLAPYRAYRRAALAGAAVSSLLAMFLFLTLRRSIAERDKHAEAMRLAALVYASSSEAMLVMGLDGRIVHVNPAFTTVTGYAAAEAVGQPGRLIRSEHNDPQGMRAMQASLREKTGWQGDYLVRRKDGSEFPAHLTVDTFYERSIGAQRHVVLVRDITEQRRAEQRIWRQANIDVLTALPNRRMFTERLRQDLLAAQRGGHSLALLFVDLDRFKEVNDTFGHDQGDHLLQEVTARITATVRRGDTVARFGGDEFTVILPGLGDVRAAQAIVQAMLAGISVPILLGGQRVSVSASIGVALYPHDGVDAESLLGHADRAMYAAKRAGRNRWSRLATPRAPGARAG